MSASPDPPKPESQPAPAEGAAPGAPQDPEPEDSLAEGWEEGEEEVARDEDPVVEVAGLSQQDYRPPAVVLRGRSAVREPRPSRTSLTDRAVVLRPAAHLSQQYLPTRIDQAGAWAAIRSGLSSVPVKRDSDTWGVDPHSHSDELWRDPQAISSIRVPDPAIVTAFSDIDPATEEEGQEGAAAAGARDQGEETPEYFDEDEIEAQFLARVKPPSRASSRAASTSRKVFLAEDQGAADSAPAEGTSSSVGTGAAEPSAPKRRKKSTKIPAEEVTNTGSLSPPIHLPTRAWQTPLGSQGIPILKVNTLLVRGSRNRCRSCHQLLQKVCTSILLSLCVTRLQKLLLKVFPQRLTSIRWRCHIFSS